MHVGDIYLTILKPSHVRVQCHVRQDLLKAAAYSEPEQTITVAYYSKKHVSETA